MKIKKWKNRKWGSYKIFFFLENFHAAGFCINFQCYLTF